MHAPSCHTHTHPEQPSTQPDGERANWQGQASLHVRLAAGSSSQQVLTTERRRNWRDAAVPTGSSTHFVTPPTAAAVEEQASAADRAAAQAGKGACRASTRRVTWLPLRSCRTVGEQHIRERVQHSTRVRHAAASLHLLASATSSVLGPARGIPPLPRPYSPCPAAAPPPAPRFPGTRLAQHFQQLQRLTWFWPDGVAACKSHVLAGPPRLGHRSSWAGALHSAVNTGTRVAITDCCLPVGIAGDHSMQPPAAVPTACRRGH